MIRMSMLVRMSVASWVVKAQQIAERLRALAWKYKMCYALSSWCCWHVDFYTKWIWGSLLAPGAAFSAVGNPFPYSDLPPQVECTAGSCEEGAPRHRSALVQRQP